MDLLCVCSVLCLLCLCARLFICALWSPAGKGLTSWLSFVVSAVSLSLSHWYPGSGVVLDCIDSWSLHPYLLLFHFCNHLAEEEIAGCLLASAVDCLWCSVSLPHSVVGWAAVCNCGISWSYYLSFLGTLHLIVLVLSSIIHLPYYRNHYSFTLVMIYF